MAEKFVAHLVVSVGEKVRVGQDFEVYTNGSNELFVKVLDSGNTYRMCSTEDGQLHVSVDEFKIRPYGACEGLVLKKA